MLSKKQDYQETLQRLHARLDDGYESNCIEEDVYRQLKTELSRLEARFAVPRVWDAAAASAAAQAVREIIRRLFED